MTPDLTARQAQIRLALPCTTFWREIWRAVAAGLVKPVKWGKTYTFAAAEIEAMRAARVVTCRADLMKLTDGRTQLVRAMRGFAAVANRRHA